MSYEVRLSPAAARQYRKLPVKTQKAVRVALEKTASRPPGSRGGKSLKMVQGRQDRFYRLRAGSYRIMFDWLQDERVILVLGIIDRRDLERWLRGH